MAPVWEKFLWNSRLEKVEKQVKKVYPGCGKGTRKANLLYT